MAENKNQSSNNKREVVAEEKKDNGGGEKKNKDSNSFTELYKIHMHCKACGSKIKRCVKGFQGVEDVKAEIELNKLTVVGKVDPTMLRDKLLQKTKKDVELISPLPPEKDNNAAADDNKTEENKNQSSNNNREVVAEEKKDNGGGEKKNKDSNSFTELYKIDMHCEACAFHRKIKGVEDAKAEIVLDKLTVVGIIVDPTMVKDYVYKRTKMHAEIVSPKKQKYGGDSRGDVDKKDGNGGGGGGSGSGGGKKKGGGGDGLQEEDGGGGGGENRMDGFGHPGFGYYDHSYGYGNGFVNGYGHANGSEWEWICA